MSENDPQNVPSQDAKFLSVDRRSLLKLTGLTAAAIGVISMSDMTTEAQAAETWDKTFPKSDKVDHQKVSFMCGKGLSTG